MDLCQAGEMVNFIGMGAGLEYSSCAGLGHSSCGLQSLSLRSWVSQWRPAAKTALRHALLTTSTHGR